MNVCILNFSGRTEGNCKRITDYICDKFFGSNVERFDFNGIHLTPCGKCEAECFKNRESCPYIDDLTCSIYDCIVRSEIVFFVVPNYCDYPCAKYFIFNERSQCYFQGREEVLNKYLQVKKKFIVVSNTQKDNFLTAFSYQCEEGVQPETLFLSARSYGKLSIDGDITESAIALKDIDNFISR